MARMYTERDREIEEKRLLRQRKAFEARSDWEKKRAIAIRKDAAAVKEVVNAAIDARGKGEMRHINLGGRSGDIFRVTDASTVTAETEHGDALLLNGEEKFRISLIMNIEKKQSLPWVFKLENGEEVKATVNARTKLDLYVDGKKVPEEEVDKKFSHWKDQFEKRAYSDIERVRALREVNAEQEARERFVAQARKNKLDKIDR